MLPVHFCTFKNYQNFSCPIFVLFYNEAKSQGEPKKFVYCVFIKMDKISCLL